MLHIERVVEAFPCSVLENDQVRVELSEVARCEVGVPFLYRPGRSTGQSDVRVDETGGVRSAGHRQDRDGAVTSGPDHEFSGFGINADRSLGRRRRPGWDKFYIAIHANGCGALLRTGHQGDINPIESSLHGCEANPGVVCERSHPGPCDTERPGAFTRCARQRPLPAALDLHPADRIKSGLHEPAAAVAKAAGEMLSKRRSEPVVDDLIPAEMDNAHGLRPFPGVHQCKRAIEVLQSLPCRKNRRRVVKPGRRVELRWLPCFDRGEEGRSPAVGCELPFYGGSAEGRQL